MAMKLKMLKLLTENLGYAQVTNRRPTPRPPVIYLMQLREHVAETTSPRRKLIVSGPAHPTEQPLPVKINHVTPDAGLFPVTLH